MEEPEPLGVRVSLDVAERRTCPERMDAVSCQGPTSIGRSSQSIGGLIFCNCRWQLGLFP